MLGKRRRFYKEWLSYLRLFVILSLAIIVLVGGLQYYLSYQVMEEAAIASSASLLSLFRENQEIILRQIDKSMTSVFTNTLFQQYMEYYHEGRYVMLMNIAEQLDNIVRSNDHIQSVCIYYRKDAYTLSSDLGPAPLSYYHDQDFLQSLDSLDFKYTYTARRQMRYTFGTTETPVITLVRTLPSYYLTTYPDAYVIINIDLQYIHTMASQMVAGGESILLVLDEKGNIIIGQEESGLEPSFLYGLQEAYTPGHETIRLDGKDMLLTKARSDANGWLYVYLQPTVEVMGDVSRLQNTLWMVSAIALILSLVLSLLFSYRVFEPIRSISARFDGLEEEGGDAFDRESAPLIQRVNALIARNTQLEAGWHQANLVDRERAFLAMLTGQAAPPDAQAEFPDGEQMILLLTGSATPQELRTEALAQALQDQQARLYMRVAPFPGTMLLAIQGHSLSDPDRVLRIAKKVRDVLSSEQHLSLGVSEAFTSLDALATAYQQARGAYDWRILHGLGSISLHRAVPVPQRIAYPIRIEVSILKGLNEQRWSDVKEGVQQFEHTLRTQNATPEAVRDSYLLLYFGTQRWWMEKQAGTHEWLHDMRHTDLLSLEDIVDMSAFMLALYARMMQAPQKREHHTRLVADVCAYIDANLHGDLSIDRLVERFKVSSSFLRKTFRDEMHVTVKEYIDSRRILRAKALLAQDDMKIQDIAAQVGFLYPQSFIAFFRSMVGMTPGEYRICFGKGKAGKSE